MRDLNTIEKSSVSAAGVCPGCYYGYAAVALMAAGYVYHRFEKAGTLERGIMGMSFLGAAMALNTCFSGNDESSVHEVEEVL